MYLIYVFILFEFCLLILNSCIYSIHVFIIFELMYLFNSCIYSIHVFIIFEFMYLLFLNICVYVFIYYYFEPCLLLCPFYDLMIFIYNPKELKLSSRKQYK